MGAKSALKDAIKNFVAVTVFHSATVISPKLNTQLRFLQNQKRFADLKNPKTFTEKLSWLKLNYCADNEVIKQCSDKYRVREYVKSKGLGDMLIPLVDKYADTKEIIWETLPDKFVLKWNFGSGYNYLCSNKANADEAKAKALLDKWKKNKFWLKYAEMQYKITDKEKVILCEKFLETDGELLDYKFYCFNGKPLAVLVISRQTEEDNAAVFMSPEWELISSEAHKKYKRTILPQKPESLDEMLKASEILSADFPFVRVDFYECNGKPYFGELTFTPAAGIQTSETIINGKTMGELLDIDFIIKNKS